MESMAAWYPDPFGRHQQRYWDGNRWTEHVADSGVTAIDHPIPSPPPPAASSAVGPRPAPGSYAGEASNAFPHVNGADADRLQRLLEMFEAASTIEATESPARELASLSGSAGWDDSRSIWTWFTAWCQQASALGSPLTAVRIAEFTQTYHDRFVPASGKAWVFLGKATDAQRWSIENAAFEACVNLDPAISVRADMELPVCIFHRYLSERLGRPID